MKYMVLPFLLISSLVSASALDKLAKPEEVEVLSVHTDNIVAPRDLGQVGVLHHGSHFAVVQDNKLHEVHNYNVCKNLRGIPQEDLKNFLDNGYVKVIRKSDGEFALEGNARLNGGGVIAGRFGYWITKSLCWSVIGAAAAGAVTATNGAILPAIKGATVKSAASYVVSTTASASKGAGFLSSVWSSLGWSKACAKASAAALQSTGSGTGLVTTIEVASTAVGTWLTVIPWLP